MIILTLKSEKQECENRLFDGKKIVEIIVQKEENKSDNDLYSNISMENSDYNPQSEDWNNFIANINKMINEIKKVTKTKKINKHQIN